MSVRFPHIWRVEPGAHYWRARRRRGQARPSRYAAALLARLRRRMRPRRGLTGRAPTIAD
jgi:glutathione S-transferase